MWLEVVPKAPCFPGPGRDGLLHGRCKASCSRGSSQKALEHPAARGLQEGNNPGSCCEWYRTCRLEDYMWDCTQVRCGRPRVSLA